MILSINPINIKFSYNNLNNERNSCKTNEIYNKSISFKGLADNIADRSIVQETNIISKITKNETLNAIIEDFKQLPQVEAISIGGSNAANTSDLNSDIDIEIFTNADIPPEERLKIIKKYSSKYDVGQEYFGPNDEFYADKMETDIDICYFDKKMMENNLQNVWYGHKPSNGYTTCFLFTLKNCSPLYDRNSWLQDIKNQLNTSYPKNLKENIIHSNMQLMKDKPFASYYEQINKAIKRDDKNSINHRVSAFMASYFDLIFAMNEQLHPGEKKLVQYAKKHCKKLPDKFEENINRLYSGSQNQTLEVIDDMIVELKKCI